MLAAAQRGLQRFKRAAPPRGRERERHPRRQRSRPRTPGARGHRACPHGRLLSLRVRHRSRPRTPPRAPGSVLPRRWMVRYVTDRLQPFGRQGGECRAHLRASLLRSLVSQSESVVAQNRARPPAPCPCARFLRSKAVRSAVFSHFLMPLRHLRRWRSGLRKLLKMA